jgi:hypothetical protein
MRLLPYLNARDLNESTMQLEMALKVAWIKRLIKDGRMPKHMRPNVYTEVGIPSIGRRSDIIARWPDGKMINIECKLDDYGVVIQQARDHLRWADYSYICFYADAYFPARSIQKLVQMGIGLIYWRPGKQFTEVVQSYYNTYKGGKDKKIRMLVESKLRDKEPMFSPPDPKSEYIDLYK